MSEQVIYIGTEPHTFCRGGSFDGWKEGVAKRAPGNNILVFHISAALAGPALYVVGEENHVYHFYADSTVGKSTAMAAAASANGGPKHARSWRATKVGLEQLAFQFNDHTLFLDEIRLADPRVNSSDVIYELAEGEVTTRGRANRNGNVGLAPRRSWRVLVVSNGEYPIRQHCEARGEAVFAGHEVRCHDISCGGYKYGAFDEIYDAASPEQFAQSLTDAARTNYGWAFRDFISHFTGKPYRGAASELRLRRDLMAVEITKTLKVAPNDQVKRVIRHFALVGAVGEMAADLGTLPWEKGVSETAMLDCFKRWTGANRTETLDIEQAMNKLKLFFEQHGSDRFDLEQGHDALHPVRDRAGFRGQGQPNATPRQCQEREALRWVLPEAFRKICEPYDFKKVARASVDRGWLNPRLSNDGQFSRSQKSVHIGIIGRTVGVYEFDLSKVLGADADEPDETLILNMKYQKGN